MEDYDLQEKYCNMNGWFRKKGILIDTGMVNDDYDHQFFSEDIKGDFMRECYMWEQVDGEPEQVYESVEEVIEWIEDGEPEITFEKFKRSQNKQSSEDKE